MNRLDGLLSNAGCTISFPTFGPTPGIELAKVPRPPPPEPKLDSAVCNL